jgi:ABC-2 type transport system permease protein
MELIWIARSKASALMWYASDVFVGVGIVATTYLLAERFDGIGAWSRPQILFLLGYAVLVRGTVETFFGWNVAFISRRIGRGQLDHMLLQPQPLPMTILTEGFGPLTGSGLVLVGVGLLAAAGQGGGVLWLGAFALNLVASVVVVMAIAYAWGTIAFFAPRAAEEVNSSTMEFVDQLRGFPLDGLSTFLLAGLSTVIPVALVAWLPARALVGVSAHPLDWLATPVFACIAACVASWIFGKGMDHYGRTGSVRYVSLGHRR